MASYGIRKYPPIPAQPEVADCPLTFQQERVLHFCELDPGSSIWDINTCKRLTGELDAGALQRALGGLVQGHQILRTRISRNGDGSSRQSFDQDTRGTFRHLDLSAEVGDDVEGALAAQLSAICQKAISERTYDDSLFEVVLLTLRPRDHVLLFRVHHVIADAAAVDLLWRDLGTLYDQEVRGGASALAPPSLKYSDYAIWQRRHFGEDQTREQEEYWLAEFEAEVPALDLPADKSPSPGLSFQGGLEIADIPQELVDAFQVLSWENRVLLYSGLFAAYFVLLQKLCQQEDVTVGAVFSGRHYCPELNDMAGFFVNTTAIRLDVCRKQTFAELVKKVHEKVEAAYYMQDYPFERLVRKLAPKRDESRMPLIRTMFNMVPDGGDDSLFEGLEDERWIDVATQTNAVQVDLIFDLHRGKERSEVRVEHNSGIFDRSMVRRLAKHYVTLLRQLSSGWNVGLSELTLVDEEEKRQLVTEWNPAPTPYARDKCIHELFEEQARERAGDVAVVDGDVEWTYGELNKAANRLARALREKGVGPDSIVAILGERSADMVLGELGILKAGGAYLPIAESSPQQRIQEMLQDAAPGALIVPDGYCGEVEFGGPVLRPGDCKGLDEDDLVHRTSPRNLAYVMYTSGSTGRPKGVMVEHRSAVNLAKNYNYLEMRADDRILQTGAPGFDATTFEIWGALLNGLRLYTVGEDVLLDARVLGPFLAEKRITMMFLTPPVFNHLVATDEAVFRPLRYVLAGGDVLSIKHVEQARQASPALTVVNVYGPTENTTFSTCHPMTRAETRTIPIGKPIPNSTAYVFDRDMLLSPVGAVGELCVGGDGTARGYHGRPALTACRFVPNPFVAGGRVYRTGDFVRRLGDGGLEFVGRVDRQVKVRGFRIELGEIENRLLDHPDMEQVVVVPASGDDGNKYLCAYYSAASEVPASGLREHLAGLLPGYMVPAYFCQVEEMPVTENGKIDQRALPPPQPVAVGSEAPRTPLEKEVAAVFAEVLGLSSPPGVDDSFFALGGHSLLVLRLVARLNAQLGTDLPMRTLFEAATVAALAARVEALRETAAGPAGEAPPPVERIARSGELPLSLAQERLWFLHQMVPDSPFYNVPWVLELRGPLDHDALQHALDTVLARHEALRTTFAPGPCSVIHPRLTVDLGARDVSAQQDAERAARAAVDAEARRPFRLEEPLVRSLLARFAEDRHLWILNVHHMVFDGGSVDLLVGELRTLYAAHLAGRPAELPELPVQYVDFAVWQRRWLAGRLHAQLVHWKERLTGAPTVLELPADRPRPQVRSQRGQSLSRDLAPRLLAGLDGVGEEGTSRFMKLLAVFAVQVYRVTGRHDFLLGMPIAHRARPELESLIGFFVNTLVLRLEVSGDPTYRQLVERVRAVALDAFAHQDVPFERLVEELEPSRDLSRDPLVQVLFGYERDVRSFELAPGLTAEALAAETGTAKFDFSLHVLDSDRPQVAAEFRSDLFDAGTVERLLDGFENLLADAVASPDKRVSELRLLGPAEAQLVAGFSRTAAPDLPQLDVVSRFAAQVRERPQAVAVAWHGGAWSYGELDARSNRLARHLRALGVGAESPVGVSLERSPELVLAILAVVKAGGCYVPFDAHYPRELLDYLVADSGVEVLVTDSSLAGGLPSPDGVRTLLLDRDAERVAAEEADPLPDRPAPDQALYVLYTSGSTGRPKGVVVPHTSVLRLVVRPGYLAADPAAPPEVDPGATFLFVAPASFDASTFEIWGALLNGARLAVAPPGKLALEDLAATIADLGADHLWMTAGLFHPMVEEHAECFRGVRHLLAGGDVLSPAHCRRVLERFPGLRLYNGYGPTENTTFTAVAAMDRPEAVTEPVSIGRPVSHTSVHVVDRHLRAVPAGVPGELLTGGAGLARGYRGRPALTAARFVPDPFGETPGRLYRTGDLARWLSDGSLSFLGRMDHQVKVRGFRVEPGEVETVLEEHPAVAHALVVAFGDGAGDKRLAAYVVAEREASGEAADGAALRSFVAERLPDYMVPSAFVELTALPLGPTGKPDRKALAEPDWGGRSARGGVLTAARTPVEEAVAEIWADVLGLGRSPGTDEDFFTLGGHSLLATRVVSRLRELFAVELPLQAVFEAPTVAGMARRVEALDAGSAVLPPIEPLPRDAAEIPLSFVQQRLWFLHRMDPRDTSYHMAGGFLLRGALTVAALDSALRILERRHETLRTRFPMGPSGPSQAIAAPAPRRLELADLSPLPPGERHRELRRFGDRLAAEPFDLAHGPVWRSALVRLGAGEHALFLVFHHVVFDGWSFGVFLRELGILYDAARERGAAEAEASLPGPGVRYADFAAWQRRVADEEMLAPHLGYWREALDGVQPLRLPTDGDLAAEGDSRGGEARLVLPAAASRDLRRLAAEHNVTLFMTLLAAFQTLLGRLARQDDVVVGSPLAGRDHTATEGVLGCFLETLALRTDLSGRPTFRQLLARVRETVLEAYAHRHVPFEKLVEELQPPRRLTRHPFFDVMLNMVNLPTSDAGFEDLEVETLEVGDPASKLWMTLYAEEEDDRLVLRFLYRRALFSARRMDDLLGQLEGLLAQVTADCDRPLDAYSLVPAGGDPRLPDPTVPLPMPGQEAVAATIAGWAERRGAVPALRRAGRDLSYGELWQGARRIAGRLRAAGLEPRQVVAVTGGRSFGTVTAMVAVLAGGGVLLTLDPRLPRERRRRMLELAGARYLLDGGGVAEPELLAGLGTRLLAVDPEARDLGDAEPVAPPPPPTADEPAYVFFTSGSTGTPKGVLGRAAGLAHFLAWQRTSFEVGPGDLAAQLTGLSFDVVLRDVLMPLTAGATLVLPEVEGSELLPWLAAERITRLHTVPSLARTWLNAWRATSREDAGEAGLPHLRTAFFAGEPLTDELVRDWRRTFGAGCEVVNLYGPTETTLAKCCFRLGERPLPGVQPVGRPLPETQALVLAGERLCGVGEPGEIVLRTPFCSLGYLAPEEEDARRFLPNPFTSDPGDLLYKSGDLGAYRPDGTLAILGRVDDQVKIRGVRVELGEVQAVVERHPRVAEAVATAPTDGRGERRLALYFVADGEAPTASELRRFLLGQLPEPLVPSAFVRLDALPLNANGKVDHAALPEADESARPPLASVFVAPQSELERRLTELWQRLLGRERVGVDDNFFELGGHSLLLVEMQAALPELAGAGLPVVELFRHPTVAALARRLRQPEAAGEAAPARDDRRQRAAARRRHLGQRAARAARPAPRKPLPGDRR